MGCKCMERNWRDVAHGHSTAPTEPCLYCCEKHLSTAWALARERGYVAVNRQAIIGELVGAVFHLPLDEMELSAKIREARHAIQDREGKEKAIDWEGLVRSIDSLINVQIAREKKAPEAAGKAEQ